jgi:TolB-like protein
MHANSLPTPSAASGDGAAEVRAMLKAMLASEAFSKASRMRKLLSYLVEMMLNKAGELNEYMIGIEVFARHPSTYNTGDDPIVRVQVGRLRERLRQYYALAQHSELELTIPLGSYMPALRRAQEPASREEGGALVPALAVLPLHCLSTHPDAVVFVRGLHEQLLHQLFGMFGHVVPCAADAVPGIVRHASHAIEGSLQREGQQTRVVVRVLDSASASIVWSRQFDFCETGSMALQEQLAAQICSALRQHFSAPGQLP